MMRVDYVEKDHEGTLLYCWGTGNNRARNQAPELVGMIIDKVRREYMDVRLVHGHRVSGSIITLNRKGRNRHNGGYEMYTTSESAIASFQADSVRVKIADLLTSRLVEVPPEKVLDIAELLGIETAEMGDTQVASLVLKGN